MLSFPNNSFILNAIMTIVSKTLFTRKSDFALGLKIYNTNSMF